MNLYLIQQTQNNGYDTYDSAVVAAPDAQTAVQMDPASGEPMEWATRWQAWANAPEQVLCRFLGATTEPQGVVCASYNAG